MIKGSKPLSREEERTLIEKIHADLGQAHVPRVARERLDELVLSLEARIAASEENLRITFEWIRDKHSLFPLFSDEIVTDMQARLAALTEDKP